MSEPLTVPISKIISVKNAWAWVSYLKKEIRIEILKRKKYPGSHLGFAC